LFVVEALLLTLCGLCVLFSQCQGLGGHLQHFGWAEPRRPLRNQRRLPRLQRQSEYDFSLFLHFCRVLIDLLLWLFALTDVGKVFEALIAASSAPGYPASLPATKQLNALARKYGIA
jgi:hypothetical protein